MSSLTASTDFTQVDDKKNPDVPELKKFLSIFGDNVVETINGNLDFSTNFNGKLMSVTFSSANSDVAVSHGLGRVPSGYLVYSRSASMVVYNGSSPSTSSVIYLKASATGTVGLFIF